MPDQNTQTDITTDILATIVLYNTSLERSATFQSLSIALKKLPHQLNMLVYDNSQLKMYTGKTYEHWNIHYIHDAANSGVSKAYNISMELAKKLGKKWMLLLDQDTAFPEDAFEHYAMAIQNITTSLFAPRLVSRGKIISPFQPDKGKGKMVKAVAAGSHSLDTMMPVNSGLMVSTEVFEACGGYNEAFPLDYSDFAFIHRVKKDPTNFEVLDLTCQHLFSGTEIAHKSATLARFQDFCEATVRYKSLVEPKLNVYKIMFSRAIKLTLSFWSTAFLNVAIRTLLRR